MSEFIYTTHADHNPLIQALKGQGVEIRHINFGDALDNLPQCLAYYGNLFDDIKQWRKLAALKQQLRVHGVPYVFWNRDAPWNTGMKLKNRLAMQWLKPVDIYFTHAMQNCEWFGGEAHYFPNAAQHVYYKYTDLPALRNEAAYQYDVSFFGSFANQKDLNAIARQQFLTTLETQITRSVPGIRFKLIDTSVQPLNVDQQLELIRTTKINLNYGAMCDLPGNPSWGLPERVFGIPAAGGFLLTDDRRSLANTLTDGQCDHFASVDACAAKVVQHLSDFTGLRSRAEALHHQVLERHTYAHRAKTFVQALQNYRAKVVNVGKVS